jgi:excinuclease ABC subunit C
MRFDPATRLPEMPTDSGVYLMKGHEGQVIYVGKAKNLRARLRQYFATSSPDPRPFVSKLPELLADIDVVITRTEKEALILEANLIRQYQPRFNVMLRGDGALILLRIDPQSRWPRVEVVRKRRKDQAHYFGPYNSASGVRETLRVLNRHFMLRTCTDAVLQSRTRPCLQYQIKRCPAPCVLDVNRPQYLANVQEAVLFLRGRRMALIEQLEARMSNASENLAFEQAASLRDQIQSVRQVLERQQVVLHEDIDQDIFVLHAPPPDPALPPHEPLAVVQWLAVREGRLQTSQPLYLGDPQGAADSPQGASAFLSQVIAQHYTDALIIPDEILLSHPIDDAELIGDWLSERRTKKVVIKIPERGPRKESIDTALRNAAHQLTLYIGHQARSQALLQNLQAALDLSRLPARIECFDISNLQDAAIVASQVVFIQGLPSKTHYRTYHINQSSQDDFAAMFEVISRRFRHVAEGEEDAPDLVIIDGGQGQLGAAITALSELGLTDAFDILGLAKARTQAGVAAGAVEFSEERLFKPDSSTPIILPPHSEELRLITLIRNEAHRTAIGFHRKTRDRDSLRSSLDDIPGVGPNRKRALLSHFGSVNGLRAASPDQLAQVPGIPLGLAEKILEFLGAPVARRPKPPSKQKNLPKKTSKSKQSKQ